MGSYSKKLNKILKSNSFKTSLIAIPFVALFYYIGKKTSINIEFPEAVSIEGNPKSNSKKTPNSSEKRNVQSMDFEDDIEVENNEEDIDYGICQAISSKGTQCKRKANDESGYCWQHKKIVEQEV